MLQATSLSMHLTDVMNRFLISLIILFSVCSSLEESSETDLDILSAYTFHSRMQLLRSLPLLEGCKANVLYRLRDDQLEMVETRSDDTTARVTIADSKYSYHVLDYDDSKRLISETFMVCGKMSERTDYEYFGDSEVIRSRLEKEFDENEVVIKATKYVFDGYGNVIRAKVIYFGPNGPILAGINRE